jgi:hypothetical protein
MSETIGRRRTEPIVVEDTRPGKVDIVLTPREGWWVGELSLYKSISVRNDEEVFGVDEDYANVELTREEAWRLYLVLEEVFTG